LWLGSSPELEPRLVDVPRPATGPSICHNRSGFIPALHLRSSEPTAVRISIELILVRDRSRKRRKRPLTICDKRQEMRRPRNKPTKDLMERAKAWTQVPPLLGAHNTQRRHRHRDQNWRAIGIGPHKKSGKEKIRAGLTNFSVVADFNDSTIQ
jgi:hypothetical protein